MVRIFTLLLNTYNGGKIHFLFFMIDILSWPLIIKSDLSILFAEKSRMVSHGKGGVVNDQLGIPKWLSRAYKMKIVSRFHWKDNGFKKTILLAFYLTYQKLGKKPTIWGRNQLLIWRNMKIPNVQLKGIIGKKRGPQMEAGAERGYVHEPWNWTPMCLICCLES